MHKLIQLLTMIILGTGIMSDIQAVTNTSEYKQPYYTVQISYAGSGGEYRINDIPFYLENHPGQVDVEIPVSDKIINGVNELSIIVFPYGDEKGYRDGWHQDARVEATLYVREKNEPKDTRKILTHIKLYPAQDPEVATSESLILTDQNKPILDYKSKPREFPFTKQDNQIVISRKTHTIKIPFTRREWQDGQDIENTEENYKSLLEAYRNLYSIHQKQDLTALRKIAQKVAKTQQTINYYGDIEQAYDMLNLEESWKSAEQVLVNFIEGDFSERQGLKLDIIANGKMARIVNDSGIQPILYVIKSQRMKIQYKYNFYKNKQGEWIYIM